MKKKNTITIVLALAVAIIGVVLGSQPQLTRGVFNFEPKVNAQTSSVPTQILYDQLFRLVINFRKKAEEQQLKGEAVTSFKSYFKDEAQLSDGQNQILEQTATDFIREVEPIDAQARQLIAQIRDQFKDGEVGAVQQVPPPPTELANLQQQRNALALNYRDKLRSSLGESAFGTFDNFVQQNFAQNFQSIGSIPQR